MMAFFSSWVLEVLGKGGESLMTLFSNPANRLFWPNLVLCLVVVAVLSQFFPRFVPLSGRENEGAVRALASLFSTKIWGHLSARLDVGLLFVGVFFKAVLLSFEIFSVRWAALQMVSLLDRTFGSAPRNVLPVEVVPLLFTGVLFFAWDFSRFFVHLAMHKIPFLWRFHSVHHSAEVLTPLTLYRVHPVETLLMQLRRVVVSGVLTGIFFYFWRQHAVQISLLGVNALTFVASAALSNLRHSHVFLRFGRLEYLFVSPAQHQIHHSDDEKHWNKNFGTWLSCWDLLYGSFVSSRGAPPERFGISGHQHLNLKSALLAPPPTSPPTPLAQEKQV